MKKGMACLCMALLLLTAFPALGAYTVKLDAVDPIFCGPGYDWGYARTVGEKGVFTIVEEAQDDEGNLWGRLKSGVGWVDLTRLQSAARQESPLAAAFSDDGLLAGRIHYRYVTEKSEYTVEMLFQPRENIRNVQFSLLEWAGESYRVQEVYCTMDALNPDIPFVAGAVYWGDMTTYGISFVDEEGNQRCYAVYISGRSGALVLEEYTPAWDDAAVFG